MCEHGILFHLILISHSPAHLSKRASLTDEMQGGKSDIILVCPFKEQGKPIGGPSTLQSATLCFMHFSLK